MTAKVEIELESNLEQIPEQHRRGAERKAKEAFVLSLLEQGDCNVARAAEILGIDPEQVVKLAAARNISTTEIDALRLGIDPKIMEYMKRQSDLFDEMREELLVKYRGKWVIFEDGHVLDADRDYAALASRAHKTIGDRQVLTKQVLPEDPQPVVRTPFRRRSPYFG